MIDPVAKARLAPLLQSVLIVDANAHAASLLSSCLTTFGAGCITVAPDGESALEQIGALNPTLFVTEALADADPFKLTRAIRHAAHPCRQAPIIVLTTLATASAVQMARAAGAHEFLRKPFTSRDMLRCLDGLARQPRPWVEKSAYTGPDRRFFNTGAALRRLADRLELVGQGASATSLYLSR